MMAFVRGGMCDAASKIVTLDRCNASGGRRYPASRKFVIACGCLPLTI